VKIPRSVLKAVKPAVTAYLAQKLAKPADALLWRAKDGVDAVVDGLERRWDERKKRRAE
jgi:hypothetical protein